jgi:acyl-[acyl-carrier-protein] desaturase
MPQNASVTNSEIDPEDAIIAHQLTAGRSDWDEELLPAPKRRCSVQAQLEERFFETFLSYMQNAEQRRRWSVTDDIPWEKTTLTTSETTADLVETFASVEMFLPDYTSKIMELVRESRGRAWFQANWGYEESKHSQALEKWLVMSQKRTPEQLEELEWSLLGAEWDLPFDTPRQMICYTMIQELATGVNYVNLRQRAKSEGDETLTKVLAWLSADESAHYNFFRRGVKAHMALQPDETIADLKFVFEHFAMPAQALIPDWGRRGDQIETSGVFSGRVALSKVFKPVLEDLGLTRSQLKAAGMPVSEADELADTMEERSDVLSLPRWQRVHSLPSIPNSTPSTRKTIAVA